MDVAAVYGWQYKIVYRDNDAFESTARMTECLEPICISDNARKDSLIICSLLDLPDILMVLMVHIQPNKMNASCDMSEKIVFNG
jgi:hypothetical protein